MVVVTRILLAISVTGFLYVFYLMVFPHKTYIRSKYTQVPESMDPGDVYVSIGKSQHSFGSNSYINPRKALKFIRDVETRYTRALTYKDVNLVDGFMSEDLYYKIIADFYKAECGLRLNKQKYSKSRWAVADATETSMTLVKHTTYKNIRYRQINMSLGEEEFEYWTVELDDGPNPVLYVVEIEGDKI